MKNKITAPKKTTIKGQPHQLAYINDKEQGLLMALGGAGVPVHGIPAYYDEGDGMESSGGDQMGQADGTQGAPDGGNHNGGEGFDRMLEQAQKQARENLEKSLASKGGGTYANPMANSQMTAADMFNNQAHKNFIDANYDLSNQSGSYNGQRIFGGTTAQQRAALQEAAAKGSWLAKSLLDDIANYKTTGYIENPETGLIGGYMSKAPDVVQGAWNLFRSLSPTLNLLNPEAKLDPSLVEVYTGPEKFNPHSKDRSEADGAMLGLIDPLDNPLTGEKTCPDGYMFDEQLQACRLDTGYSGGGDTGGGVNVDMSELYYRPTSLDAPSAFQPSGFDYDSANKGFVDSFAYNPANYKKQMNLTGFVPTSGLLT